MPTSRSHQAVKEDEEDYANLHKIDILNQFYRSSSVEEYIPVPIAKEKQKFVDPATIKKLTNAEGDDNNSTFLPATSVGGSFASPFPLQLIRPNSTSCSLPCSTTSSPQPGRTLIHSPQNMLAISKVKQNQETHLRRSKSCGDGRASAPSDEFDIWPKPRVLPEEVKAIGFPICIDEIEYATKSNPNGEENFKCGALCMFLPGFSKGKQVQCNKYGEEDRGTPISRAVSLEKFECGSWASSAIIDCDEDNESMNSYFDLPLELIRNCTNEMDSPVKSAFVFENRKGVLKKNKSRLGMRKLHDSSNHRVRFSTSPPASQPSSPSSFCISPRLQKAREDFNALLQAQGA